MAVDRAAHTQAMLARATWASRLVAVVALGALTFVWTPAHGVDLTVEIIGYALCVTAMGAWFAATQRHWPSWVLVIAWVVCAAVGGGLTEAPNAGALVGFAFMATLGGGSDTDSASGWWVFALAVLGVETGALIWGASTSGAIGFPLGLMVAFIGGRNRRGYRVQAETSARMLRQVEALREIEQQVAVLDERTRIAREIHDVLAHSLGALGIQIQAVRAVLTDSDDTPQALALLDQAQRIAADGLVETRRAVRALRGDTTRLDEQVAELAKTHCARHDTSVTVHIDGEPIALTPEATVALVRTTQEALVNGAKHAPHQPIDIHLAYRDDLVRLTIVNPLSVPAGTDSEDGATGGDPTAGAFHSIDGGYGLTGMRERLLLIQGELTAMADEQHWTVDATVPQ